MLGTNLPYPLVYPYFVKKGNRMLLRMAEEEEEEEGRGKRRSRGKRMKRITMAERMPLSESCH